MGIFIQNIQLKSSIFEWIITKIQRVKNMINLR